MLDEGNIERGFSWDGLSGYRPIIVIALHNQGKAIQFFMTEMGINKFQEAHPELQVGKMHLVTTSAVINDKGTVLILDREISIFDDE